MVLAGAVALASTGFAIGSQSDDGSAGAARGSARTADGFRGGPGRGFESLADRLGVSEAKLRAALDDLRPTGDPEDELAAALAKSLGVDESKVTDALTQLRDQHEQRHEAERNAHADALAKALGIEASRVRQAFENLEPDRDAGGPPPRRRDFLADLAKELGVSQAKLRTALRKVRPPRGDFRRGPGGPGGPGGPHGDHRGDHRGGPGGPLAADLAKALGVDEADVRDALDAFHDAKRDEFAQKLADKLGIDVDKVKEALPDHP